MRNSIMDKNTTPWQQPVMNTEVPPPVSRGAPVWVWIIAGIIIIGTVAFLGKALWDTTRPTAINNTDNITRAYTYGMYSAILQIINSTNNCQVTSIRYYNNSRELVDLSCVRELLRQANISG